MNPPIVSHYSLCHICCDYNADIGNSRQVLLQTSKFFIDRNKMWVDEIVEVVQKWLKLLIDSQHSKLFRLSCLYGDNGKKQIRNLFQFFEVSCF